MVPQLMMVALTLYCHMPGPALGTLQPLSCFILTILSGRYCSHFTDEEPTVQKGDQTYQKLHANRFELGFTSRLL